MRPSLSLFFSVLFFFVAGVAQGQFAPHRAIEFEPGSVDRRIELPVGIPATGTFEAWIAPDNCRTGAHQYNVIYLDSNFFFFCYSSGVPGAARLQLQETSGSYPTISTSADAVLLNRWSHIAVTFEQVNAQRDVRVYVNGSAVPLSRNSSPDLSLSDDRLTSTFTGFGAGGNGSIGKSRESGTSDNHFVGGIDEIRIWDVARTQAEIQSSMLFRMAGPNLEAGLLASYSGDRILPGTNGP